MNIDFSKAPEGTEAAHPGSAHVSPAWFKRDLAGLVEQICPEAGIKKWTWMGGRRDFPCGHVLRPESDNQSWSGEGLPPVGTVCEVGSPGYRNARFDRFIGQVVTVVAHDVIDSDPVAVFRMAVDGQVDEQDYHALVSGCFRPLRTPEQIAEEARIAELNLMVAAINDYPRGRHGVDHLTQLKIHEEACINLYDAGWRKQVVE